MMPASVFRVPIGYLIFGILCMAIPATYITYRVLTPSDGARLVGSPEVFTKNAIIVTPYGPTLTPLQDGDLVLAVDGVQVSSYTLELFPKNIQDLPWQLGQRVTYSILRDGRPLDISIKLGRFPLSSVLSKTWGALLFTLVSQIVAGFVLFARPDKPAARALFIWAMAGSHTYGWVVFLQLYDMHAGLGFWLFNLVTPGLWVLYWPAMLHVALVFPKPLAFVKRNRWLPGVLYLASIPIYFGFIRLNLDPSDHLLEVLNLRTLADGLVAMVFLFLTIITLFYQYVSRPSQLEREQMRWAVYGAGLSGTIGLVFWFLAPWVVNTTLLSTNLLGLLMLPFPIALAISIWRYQLFDIDIIIRKTLLYASLTAVLLVFYFGGIIILQRVFYAVSGQESPIAIVISTLAIAALFNPLRQRIQTFIDRRFFRRKYNAEQALNAFANAAREQVDIKALIQSLFGVIDETIKPNQVELWLAVDSKPVLRQRIDQESKPTHLLRKEAN